MIMNSLQGYLLTCKKAFGTVYHEMLIGKLEHYGVNSDNIDRGYSGLVLGPLLFHFYYNGPHNYIKYFRT